MSLRFPCVAGVLLAAVACAVADDAYYSVRLRDLKITAGRLKEADDTDPVWQGGSVPPAAYARVVLEGGGEAFCTWSGEDGLLVARAAAGRDVVGRLFVPRPGRRRMDMAAFVIPHSSASPQARSDFWRLRRDHYERLMGEQFAGAAWFRHQVAICNRELGAADAGRESEAPSPWRTSPQIEETFDVFTGNRAIAENLQLDRMMPVRGSGAATVKVDTIKGIQTKELDWPRLLAGADPPPDPLAAAIPSDQHAVFFPSFEAFCMMMEEAERYALPLIQAAETHGHDFALRQRYQRQLCLNLGALAKALGPNIIGSVALTGSDPFLRMGSDVAVVLEAKDVGVLRGLLVARMTAGAAAHGAASPVGGEYEGAKYEGFASADRSISALVMVLDNAVVVSNSAAQLRRLVDVRRGAAAAMASLPEYRFFRNRYRRGDADEQAFMVLTDAAIRRWCSPRWRIADSRRLRATAVMTALLAEHMTALASSAGDRAKAVVVDHPDYGRITISATGVRSDIYGAPDMMTPIIELPMEVVSREEAAAYERWREGYERNWPMFFDPIAVRLSVGGGRLSADMTAMPLIGGSEYRPFMEVSGRMKLRADGGDQHDALMHAVMAIDPESGPLRQMGTVLNQWGVNVNVLSWLGGTVALYVDEDPWWKKVLELADNPERPERMLVNAPAALWVECRSPMNLTLFLMAVRGLAEGAAPGLLVWEPQTHNGQAYVKLRPSARARAEQKDVPEDLALCYVATPEALVISLNEDVIRRAIDRQQQRAAAATRPALPRPAVRPWLGSSMGLRVRKEFIRAAWHLMPDPGRHALMWQSWANIPILNEWKRLAPQQDPVELHERLWGVKLTCPGGGKYVWNEQWQTMESTVYGHPGAPKKGPMMPALLDNIELAEFGLDFENDGLRARVVMERSNVTR